MLTAQEQAILRKALAREAGMTAMAQTTSRQPAVASFEERVSVMQMPDGDPRDPNLHPMLRQKWMAYLGGFGVPMVCGPRQGGPVPAPDYFADNCTGAVGQAAAGCKVPIPFTKTVGDGTSAIVVLKPNQVGVPVGLDMTRSGDGIIVTDITDFNNNSLYDQGDGDIAVNFIANIDFNQETFESDSNPFPTNATRINRTYPLNINVTNAGGVGDEVAAGVLWLRVA